MSYLNTPQAVRPFTVIDLAKELGVNRSHLNLILVGKRVPRPNLARRIEIATNGFVKASTLLGLDGLELLYQPLPEEEKEVD
jgi:hypothetical protein